MGLLPQKDNTPMDQLSFESNGIIKHMVFTSLKIVVSLIFFPNVFLL